MGRGKAGVRVRGDSLVIDFYYEGQRCRETLSLEPTKANRLFAERKRSAILNEIALGTFDYAVHFPKSRRASTLGKGSNKTVAQALDEFLITSRRTCEASTLRDYQSAVDHHLKPAFGDYQLRKLAASTIKVWIGNQVISNKRINNVLIPLRAVLKDAFIDGIIEQDVSARVRNLSHRTREPNPFTPAEISQILKHAEGQIRNLFQFAFWTGLRTSELIALEWKDIDFERRIACVRRACVRKVIKTPKTKSGEREVKLLTQAIEALNAQRPFTFEANERVFQNPSTNSSWETDGQIRKTAWIPALKAANVPYRNPYQTRHTYASMMLSSGENDLWVAHQMGHKDWGMIRKTYGRWIQGVDSKAGSKAEQYWSLHSHSFDNLLTPHEE